MDILNKHYIIAENVPPTVDFEEYYECERGRYLRLIEQDLPEKEYQAFFEENPSFMPGSREIIGSANSHWPIENMLISQPILSNDTRIRKPDFMWIAKNSLCLCPVLIEIEKPSKKEFRKDSDVGIALFTQAMTQIKQWKAILNSLEGRQNFYSQFHINEKLQKLKFTPQYVLVFGRRAEYEDNSWLTQLRAEEECSDVRIMSFDRLAMPDRNAFDCVSGKIKSGQYYVTNIPPTFMYRPTTIEAIGGYTNYRGFKEAVKKMKYTSESRKQFLLERFDYWCMQANEIKNGITDLSDKE